LEETALGVVGPWVHGELRAGQSRSFRLSIPPPDGRILLSETDGAKSER
jgi:hypothetical protein